MSEFAARVSRVRMKGGATVSIMETVAWRSIPRMLRKLAADMESGVVATPENMVSVVEGVPGIDVYGWGDGDGMHAIGLLQLGITKLASQTVKAIDDAAENS